MSGRIMRWLAWSGAALALLTAGWHWLGRVDFPTKPSEAVPSRPTVLPINETEQALQEGSEWAIANAITEHRDCRKLDQGLRALGCHEYLTIQMGRKLPPLIKSGLTEPRTRDCLAAVHAHYDPVLQDLTARGAHHVYSGWGRKVVDPLLKQCNNVDNLRVVRDVHEPQGRLNNMLAQVRAGHSLSEADLTTLRREYPEVELFRDHPVRTRYLAAAEELFSLLGGRQLVFPLALPEAAREEKCAELAQKLAVMKKTYHQSLESLEPPADVTGRSASSSDHAPNPQTTLQDQILAEWAQAEEARRKVGCPSLR